MPSIITTNNLGRIFNQYRSQSGRAAIIDLLNDIEVKAARQIGSDIARTLLGKMQREGECDPSDKQLYRLAEAVEKYSIDLSRYLVDVEQSPALIGPDIEPLRGLVISKNDEEIIILQSDGSIQSYPSANLQIGLFVEIRGNNPSISIFESGRDETWLERVWPILVEEFEGYRADNDAFINVGKKVRIGLVKDFLLHSFRDDKLDIYGRIIIP